MNFFALGASFITLLPVLKQFTSLSSIPKLQNIYDNPSGALIKAVLMNGAQFLKGVDNGSNGVTEIKPYDNNQNFGRLALQRELVPVGTLS